MNKHSLWGLAAGLAAGFLLARGFVPLTWLALLMGGCVAVNLLCAALFPRSVARTRRRLEHNPLRAFLCGLLALVAGAWLVVNLGPGAAVPLLVVGLAVVLAGMPAATAAWMGQRLAPELSARRQLVVGTWVWGASLVVPVIGWLLAAGLAVSGLGASLLGVRTA